VNELVGKGGFPQLLINPVNFEMLYQQKQAALQQRQASH
jgi:preprotein translocase subunit SecB